MRTGDRRTQGREGAALSLLRPVLKLLFNRGLAREVLHERSYKKSATWLILKPQMNN